jgi:uncharacterized membrane protein YkvA (DUF1232 family)
MDIKKKVSELKKKLSAIFIVLKRKDTPIIVKILAGITIGYALSPIDLIPDFIPILGYLDDILILPVLIALTLKFIPKNIMEECEKEAADIWKEGRPKKWYYALPIIMLWVLIIGIIVLKIKK